MIYFLERMTEERSPPLKTDGRLEKRKMMRAVVFVLILVTVFGGVALAMYSPDGISMFFIGVMEVVLVLGVIFGVMPAVQFTHAFQNALEYIESAARNRSGSTWNVLEKASGLFRQRALDAIFHEYQAKLKTQRESGQILADIDGYINEEALALLSWQSIITQVPGTLTGLGLLGTFIGLVIGIQGIEFSSINMAMTSVRSLLSGIQIAFYTSIAGVILSLMFNILYRFVWNTMLRQLGFFSAEFHRNVVPSVEEQKLYQDKREMRHIIELMERMPLTPGYSAAAGGTISGAHPSDARNEQIILPQILSGLQADEFIFYLQPRVELNTKTIVGAEALVRWNHSKLGLLAPSEFIPLMERNGYITKLDQRIWEKVCIMIREWMDQGLRPLPISINVSKTDILAMEVSSVIPKIAEDYGVSPLDLVIDIAENAYFEASSAVSETVKNLRKKGFVVTVDGFSGDYLALSSVQGFSADMLKIDLRRMQNSQNPSALTSLFAQANKLRIRTVAEGIESMEQLNILRKCGCSEGQGFYLYKAIPPDEYMKLAYQNSGKAR